MAVSIIGIDCATQPRKVGVARGVFEGGKGRIEEAILPSSGSKLVETIVRWVKGWPSTLMALDAPLGWPAQMGAELSGHQAGAGIGTEADRLFHRETDEFIYRKFGKRPLEVGANLIARTALAALNLLEDVRRESGNEILLAWEPGLFTGIYAIEVYPAVTLRAHEIKLDGYKSRDREGARRRFLRELGQVIALPADPSLLETNQDVLDAAICVLAGVDFLRGEVHRPTDLELAKKEGWIWVRNPSL